MVKRRQRSPHDVPYYFCRFDFFYSRSILFFTSSQSIKGNQISKIQITKHICRVYHLNMWLFNVSAYIVLRYAIDERPKKKEFMFLNTTTTLTRTDVCMCVYCFVHVYMCMSRNGLALKQHLCLLFISFNCRISCQHSVY